MSETFTLAYDVTDPDRHHHASFALHMNPSYQEWLKSNPKAGPCKWTPVFHEEVSAKPQWAHTYLIEFEDAVSAAYFKMRWLV